MKQSNHGSHAKVGDLVELLNPSGHRTEIFALVTEVCEGPRNERDRYHTFPKRLKIHVYSARTILVGRAGPPIEQWKANFCRIISRA